MNLRNITIQHSPLTDSLYLCRFGKDRSVALDKRDIEPDLMQALVAHMTHGAPSGSRKTIRLGDNYYEIQVKPCQQATGGS